MSKKPSKKAMPKSIVIEANGEALRFSVTLKDFHNYQNKISLSNKVVPSDNFLTTCVHPDDEEKLQSFLDIGYAVDLAGALAEAFRPEVAIAVKISSEESTR